jgi:hypothetical protein
MRIAGSKEHCIAAYPFSFLTRLDVKSTRMGLQRKTLLLSIKKDKAEGKDCYGCSRLLLEALFSIPSTTHMNSEAKPDPDRDEKDRAIPKLDSHECFIESSVLLRIF